MSKPWTPRDYQLEALTFALANRNAGLMLDPGLGKTSTYLAQTDELIRRREIHRTLVCAPLRVAQVVWPAEVEKWDDFKHLKIADLTQRTDEERTELLESNYDIYVINPESLHKVINPKQLTGKAAQFLENPWRIDHFIADESTRFADPSTKRFKALKPALGHYSYRNIATGTPAPNGVHQLFGQCYVLDQGQALGEYITHFRQNYMRPHPHLQYVYEMLPGAAIKVYQKVAHLLLRMKAKDYLEMPELIHNEIRITLPPKVRVQYDEFERDFLIKVLDKTVPAFNRASLAVKCRQVANGFIYDPETRYSLPIHDAKLDALGDLLEQMQERPLLVMYEFIADGERIKARFPFAVNITGARDINDVVKRFNKGEIPLLIGHPRSAGHGLNLQEACHDICWYGVTWDLELWLQAIARIWRQGQANSVVTNHIILADDTADDGVIAGLTRKEAVQEDVDQALIRYAKAKLGYN